MKLRCLVCSYGTFRPGEVYDLEPTGERAGRFNVYTYRIEGRKGYFILALDDNFRIDTESTKLVFEKAH